MHTSQISSQHQIQQLVLTPEIRQSLRILQMSLAELDAYLAAQVTDNCVLEVSGLVAERENAPMDELPDSGNPAPDPIESTWMNHFGIIDQTGYEEYPGDQSQVHSDNYVYPESNLPSLYDHLLTQLQMVKLSEKQFRIGEFLIKNIDSSGYLQCLPAEAAAVLMVQPEEISELIRLIQSFDPPGVCCRDLPECLSLQWQMDRPALERALGPALYQITAFIIARHLAEVATGKLSRIAARLKQPLPVIRQAADQIKKLDPKPGRDFGPLPGAHTLLPDARIIKYGSSYQIVIENSPGTRLLINPMYRRLLNSPDAEPETVQYIQERLQSAFSLLKGLEQRNNTLRKIVAAIALRQQGFLENGASFLVPLTLQEIAAELGMHESTVSRAVQGKYIGTPQGVYPLKHFFQSKLNTAAGEIMAADTVKKILVELIHVENKQKPLSDQQLAVILHARGIMIARRTIAKYREELIIPPAVQRKILGR